MTESICGVDLYEIPSDTVLKHRKVFYGLWRRSDDQTTTWLERVRNCIRRCEFPKLIEYLLIDRFVCELNQKEKNSIRAAAEIWSFKLLNQYLVCKNVAIGRGGGKNATITIDNAIDQTQLILSSSMVAVKSELVS